MEYWSSCLQNLRFLGGAEEVRLVEGRLKELEQKQRLHWNRVLFGHMLKITGTTDEEVMMIEKEKVEKDVKEEDVV